MTQVRSSVTIDYIRTKIRRRDIKSVLSALTTGTDSGGLTLGETSTTAYRGDRGKIAYDHSQTTGNPHGLIRSDIGALGGSGTTNEIAYFTAATTLASLPTATYPSLTELSYVKGLRGRPSRTLLIKSLATTSVTGTTSETPVYSVLIPANTIQSGDIVFIEVTATKSGGNGVITLKGYFNETDDLITPIEVFRGGNSLVGSLWTKAQRTLIVTSSTTQIYNINTSSTDLGVFNSFTNGTIDFSTNLYFIVTITNGSSLDTSTIREVLVEIIR